jgi:hypothetical protein
MKNFSSAIGEALKQIFNLKGGEAGNSQVADVIQPVVQIEKTINIGIEGHGTNANYNIYTTPTDEDFYLTNLDFSGSKDVTSTTTRQIVYANVDGKAQNFAVFQGLTLTAETWSITKNFTGRGIKVDRGSTISVQADNYTAANIASGCSIQGRLVSTKTN